MGGQGLAVHRDPSCGRTLSAGRPAPHGRNRRNLALAAPGWRSRQPSTHRIAV